MMTSGQGLSMSGLAHKLFPVGSIMTTTMIWETNDLVTNS